MLGRRSSRALAVAAIVDQDHICARVLVQKLCVGQTKANVPCVTVKEENRWTLRRLRLSEKPSVKHSGTVKRWNAERLKGETMLGGCAETRRCVAATKLARGQRESKRE